MTVIRVLSGPAVLAAAIGVGAIVAQEKRITTWLPAPAVILESREESYSSRIGSRVRSGRRVRIRYAYFLSDGSLESDRIYPGPLSSTSGESASLRARFPVGASVKAYVDPMDPTRAFLVPHRSFLPHLIILLVAAPLGALAAGIATGGIRHLRSGESVDAVPRRRKGGFYSVPPFRSYRALRNASAAALAVFGPAGTLTFVHFMARSPEPSAPAGVALIAWLLLVAALTWAVLTRTWVHHRMEDGRLGIRPRRPAAGQTLELEFDQPVRTEVGATAVELTLVGERHTSRLAGGKVRSKTLRVARVRVRLPVEGGASPGRPIHVAGALEVPAAAVTAGGVLRWRVEARTRTWGPDYRTRFLIGDAGGEDE
jgi:hypothetical protein